MDWRRDTSLASRNEMAKINQMFEVIKKNGAIHRFDLINIHNVPMSISSYEKHKKLLEHIYGNRLSYDKRTGVWEYIEVPVREIEKPDPQKKIASDV